MGDIHFPGVVRYRFEAEALTPITLPQYPGSTWRGLLGSSLRRTACITGQASCDGCLLQDSCAFFNFFESPTGQPAGRMRGALACHPFVLDLAPQVLRSVRPGEAIQLGINVIGDANSYLPHLVIAMERAGEAGIGKGRGRFRLLRLLQEVTLSQGDWVRIFDADERALRPFASGPVALPDAPPSLRVQLVTPLRIKRRGRLVGARELSASDFLRHLCWRLEQIDQRFGSVDPQGYWESHRDLVEGLAPAATQVRWLDWARYSSRQATTMKLGGLMGILTIPDEAIEAMWPLLWLGQWVHIGKATTFGLGVYRLDQAP
jgi:hypothetical protein